MLLIAVGAVPLAVLGALAPGASLAVVVVAVLAVGVFLYDGLRSPSSPLVTIERELPANLSVGETGTVTLRLRSRVERPLSLRVADGCPAALAPQQEQLELKLEPFGEAQVTYDVLPVARGSFAFEALQLRCLAPLGLAEHQLTMTLPTEARVHPNMRNLKRYQLRARRDLLHQGGARRTRMLGRDGDFERMRDFVPGDDLRHVDWRATARLGRPITRVFQAEKAQNLILLVDGTRLMATRAAGLTKLDFAVNAALMLGYVGLTRGDRVGVAVFDDGLRAWLPPQSGHTQFGRILDLLFDQQPELRFPRYREAARQLARDVRRRSLLVWLTDLLDGEQGRELLLALRAVRRKHLSLVVAIDDPDVHRLASTDPKDEEAFFVRSAAAELLDQRSALIRRLHAEGAQVLDRRPEEITAALVDRYLDLKQRGAL